jgi:polar amino acid transport system substrate-binding protein
MKISITNSAFEAMLPGLDSGRFDLIFAAMIDKAEREQKYDGINITTDRYSWAAKKDLAPKTKAFSDLCGYKAGILTGTAYTELVAAASKKCVADGKKKIEMVDIENDAQGFLALKSGRIDYYPNNLPLIKQWVKGNTDYAPTPFTMLTGPSAIWLKKGSPYTAKIAKAFQSMMDDGTYAKILAKWNVTENGIDKALIDPVTRGLVKPVVN